MIKIGGNTSAVIQCKGCSGKNEIGEYVTRWVDADVKKGWLDLQSGDSKHTSFNAKMQESTHVFVTDFFDYRNFYIIDSESRLIDSNGELILDSEGNYINVSDVGLNPGNSRLVVFGQTYEIMLIDDPMELHQQIEIYLKFVGGANGGHTI